VKQIFTIVKLIIVIEKLTKPITYIVNLSYPVVIGLEDPLDKPILKCPLMTVTDLGRIT
jgi:hypothetical protein